MRNRIQTIAGIATASALMGVAAAAAASATTATADSQTGGSADIATLDSLEASLSAGGVPSLSEQAAPSDNATINLLRLLVKQGVLSHEDAVVLIRQAETEAAMVKSQAEAVQGAADQLRAAAQSEIDFNESDVRITYIPETVKSEIADDVSHNVMERARRENWAAQSPGPEWLQRLSLFADMRMRYEGINYPSGNGPFGMFPDFNAINTGKPYDESGAHGSAPQINAWENRERTRIRARFGFEAQMEEGLTLGMRLATGSGSSPVSTNQTLGSPGNFSRYQVWIDRAYLRWDYQGEANLSVSFGRFENPFFSTEIIWDDDIGFDGVAVQLSAPVSNQTTAFLTAGAFPIFNNSLNIPMGQRSDSASNFKSENRYLFAVQGGIEQKITKNIEAKFAVGYYYFQNVQGSLSAPYAPESDSDAGSTDGLRPTFAQKGNTYMGLRNLQNSPVWNNNGQENMWQYYGLATPFRVLSATAKVDFNHFEPFQISLFGEFVNNFGVSASDIENIGIGGAVNNRNGYIDPVTNDLVLTNYNGGGMGWIVGVSIGDAVLDERWKWRAGVDYRYMESDSFIDGFVGSDFGMGGTNLKGVTVGGRMALFKSVSLGARWMSASEVSGEAYRADIFQLDLTARF